MTHIIEAFPQHVENMQFDRPITRVFKQPFKIFRPDLWWDLHTHGLIVEVDEQQHNKYSKTVEFERSAQLHIDAQKPVVFLRFNPDGYRDSDSKHHSTCFSKTGVLACEEDAWRQRLSVLVDRIMFVRGIIPVEALTEEFLFFDGYQSNDGSRLISETV